MLIRATRESCNFIKKNVSLDQLRLQQNLYFVPDWSRFKSSEPNAGHMTCTIGPLYFTYLHNNAIHSHK